MIVIEDDLHADQHGHFMSFDDAVAELKRRAGIAWDEEPNRAPCEGWQTCGRSYWIVEYDESALPWSELRRVKALEVSLRGIAWSLETAGA